MFMNHMNNKLYLTSEQRTDLPDGDGATSMKLSKEQFHEEQRHGTKQ